MFLSPSLKEAARKEFAPQEQILSTKSRPHLPRAWCTENLSPLVKMKETLLAVSIIPVMHFHVSDGPFKFSSLLP